MTYEEFMKKVAGFGGWVNKDRERSEAAWWYSLEEYAAQERGRAQRKEHEK